MLGNETPDFLQTFDITSTSEGPRASGLLVGSLVTRLLVSSGRVYWFSPSWPARREQSKTVAPGRLAVFVPLSGAGPEARGINHLVIIWFGILAFDPLQSLSARGP